MYLGGFLANTDDTRERIRLTVDLHMLRLSLISS